MLVAIGQRIRARRVRAGLSQADLARLAGLSKGFMCDVEHGRRGISALNLYAIARVLDVTTDWLIDGDQLPLP